MNGTASSAVVRIQRVLPASPERVYAAWTDPAILARWLSPIGHAEADVEPWVGGRLRVAMVSPGVRIEHSGEYRELVPPRRLVFTWQSPYTGPTPSLVTIDLEPVESGTALTLLHEQLPPDQVESHGGGWGQILERLAAVLVRDSAAGGP
jgi:uncharacterized protein YndB with AHSA1/START domain